MVKKLKHGVAVTRLEFLRSVPLFSGLPDNVLARIDSHMDEVDWPAGRSLTVQGKGSYEAFVIAEGTAEVSIDGQVKRHAGPGEMIGELGVLQRGPRTATVTAQTPMRLLVINPRDLDWLFEDPVLAQRVQDNVQLHTD